MEVKKKYIYCLICQLVEKGRDFTITENQLPIVTLAFLLPVNYRKYFFLTSDSSTLTVKYLALTQLISNKTAKILAPGNKKLC